MPGSAPPTITDVYQFAVSGGLISTGGSIDGSGNGTTVTGISTDGVNFTPTDSSDPSDQSATVDGQYLSFSADANGDGTQSAIPDDQTVIDDIQANESSSTPLSDTFYYQLTNSAGTTVEQVTYDLDDVEFGNNGAPPYSSAETVPADTATNIAGLTVDKALADGQTTDSNEVLDVTVGLFDYTTQQSDGDISIDSAMVGSGGGTGETITTTNTGQTHSVTIDGTIAQINADLQGLTYTSGAAGGDDSILIQAVDGPATTADLIFGEVKTTTATAGGGTPLPVNNTYNYGFTVTPGLYADSGNLDDVPSGDTVVGISTDDVNFTPVTTTDPTYQNSAEVDGQYLFFKANADGTAQNGPIPDDQTVINDIQADDTGTAPLTDTFYYEVSDGTTTRVDQVNYSLNDIEINTSQTSPYNAPETVEPGTSTSIAGITVDTALATGQTTDAGEVLTVTVGLFDYTTQQSDGDISINPSAVGSGGETGETITTDNTDQTHTVTIDGTIAQINADLEGLTYTSGAAGGDDFITLQAVDGPATTSDFIIGEVKTACYCPGSLIRTEDGETPVEDLRIGDRIATLNGGMKPIKWIGRRSYDGRFLAGQVLMLPVCVKQGAVDANVPARDLWVSAGHALYVDGVLIPAWLLVNGSSIVQPQATDSVTYIHIELDEHEVIFAESCPAESFIDDDCRNQFQNAAEFHALYPSGQSPRSLCAQRVESGFQLQAIQRRLADRAGISTTPSGVGPLRGFVDHAGPGTVSGWAQDFSQPETPVSVDILVDGRRVQRVLANHYRADLRKAGIGSGKHSFEVCLPRGVTGRVEVRRSIDQASLRLTEAAWAKAA